MSKRMKVCLLAIGIGLALCFSACAYSDAAHTGEVTLPENLIPLPVTRQSTAYTCGVACVQSLLYYNGIDFREDVLAAELGSTAEDGTNIDRLIDFLQNVTADDGWWLGLGTPFYDGIGAQRQDNMSLEELCTAIDAAQPVICCLQAWYGESGYDYSDEWECGHYAIAVGYDQERIFFMDPSTLGNYTYIEKEEFLTRWHDSANGVTCNQLGIVIENPNPVFSANQVLPME